MKTKLYLIIMFLFLSFSNFANDKKITKLENQIDQAFLSDFKARNVNWELIETSYYEYLKQHLKNIEKGKLKFEYFQYKNFWVHNRGGNLKYFSCDSIKKEKLISTFELLGLEKNNVKKTIRYLYSIYQPYINKKWQTKYEKETIILLANTLSIHNTREDTFLNHNDFVSYLIHKMVSEINLDKEVVQKTLIIAGFADIVFNYCKEAT